MRLLPAPARLLLGVAALLCAGCFEADLELTLLADGRGVLRLGLALPRQALPGDDAALAGALAAHLKGWRGVDAWSERDLLVAEGEGRVQLVATGWCRDARQLRAPLPPGAALPAPVLRLEPGERGLLVRLAWEGEPRCAGMDAPAWAAERRRLLEQAAALGEARCRLRLNLPAPPGKLEGAVATGRVVERVWEGPRLREALEALAGELELLRARVAAGTLPAEEAARREVGLVPARLGLAVECAPPADDGGAGALFERGFQAASEAWSRFPAQAPGPVAAVPGEALPPGVERARREEEEARRDQERAMQEVERWRAELEEMEAEHDEDEQRAAAEEDPTHARLRIELTGAPPGAQAQVVAQPPAGLDVASLGAGLEAGRFDAGGVQPGLWRLTLRVVLPEGPEWVFTREARLLAGGFSRVTFAWPRAGSTVAGKAQPGAGRVVRAWSAELRVSGPLGPDGAFSLGPLPPGAWRVAVTEGAGPWVEDPAQLPAAAELTLEEGGAAREVAPPGVLWDGQASRVLWR